MRVLTYNLLAGEADDAERLGLATSLLRAARVDVLGLNECALLARDDGARLRELEATLGLRGFLAPAASGFHVALLVRDAWVEHVTLLSSGLAHSAVIARLRVGSHPLQVVAAHLDPFSASRRRAEVELLAERLDRDRPSLLLGDLNAVSPRDAGSVQPERWVARYRERHLDSDGALDTRALEFLEQHGLVDVHAALHAQPHATRPTPRFARDDRPSQRLDFIFATSELARAASSCEPYDHPCASTASDHLPLYADFAWPQ